MFFQKQMKIDKLQTENLYLSGKLAEKDWEIFDLKLTLQFKISEIEALKWRLRSSGISNDHGVIGEIKNLISKFHPDKFQNASIQIRELSNEFTLQLLNLKNKLERK